jgi:hypothetical protein
VVVRTLPGAGWYFSAAVLVSLPFVLGWLASYGISSGGLNILTNASFLLGCLCAIGWAVLAARSGGLRMMLPLLILAVWTAGVMRLGTWIGLSLWNPDVSPPFMTEPYALQQGLIGLATCSVATALFLIIFYRRGAARG